MPRATQWRNERGAMAIEFLLAITMLILVFLLMLQYAVKVHTQRVDTAAAEQALSAAAAYDGSATDGDAAANDYLSDLGPGLGNADVAVPRTATTATVTVSGDVDQ